MADAETAAVPWDAPAVTALLRTGRERRLRERLRARARGRRARPRARPGRRAGRAPARGRRRAARRLRRARPAADRDLQRRARRLHHRRAPAVPQRGGPPPAADAGRGDRAVQADRARRPRGEGPPGHLEPAARRVDRPQVPERRRADPARPDPGGHARADPRRREVRLAQGLPLLHLRDAVDPPGDQPRARRARPHDPAADQRRPARAQDRQRRARAEHAARPAADAGGARRARREVEPRQIEELRDVARKVTSLERPVGDDGETELGELLPGDEPPPEEEVEVALRDETVRAVVQSLPDREREVIELRFGLNGDTRPGVGPRDRPPARGPARRRAEARAARARGAGAAARDGGVPRDAA